MGSPLPPLLWVLVGTQKHVGSKPPGTWGGIAGGWIWEGPLRSLREELQK